ncbi:MAG: hypothetical protein JKP96_08440 [Oceanicaulis sp.]|jgi:hypothetical protein|nr:hypothetical protein [Oceanicaulis sp.]
MELATADAVQPREGEAAFILQLRPPETANADALAAGLDRFTSLFLERAVSDRVRFSPLGALTWALCSPVEHVDDVDAACDELANTLFGDPASEAVHLARQPDLPRQEDYRIHNQALSDEEGEAVMHDLAEHEWDFETNSDTETSGADEGAGDADLDDGAVDLDAFDASGEDDWALATPIDDDPVVVLDDTVEGVEPASATDTADGTEFEPEAEIDAEEEDDFAFLPDAGAEADSDAAPELETEAEPELAIDPEPALEDGFELGEQPETEPEAPELDSSEAGADIDDALGAEGRDRIVDDDDFVLAQADDEVSMAEPDDAEAEAEASLEAEPALQDVLEDALDEINATSRIWDENADTVDIDDIAASALHETRLGSQTDIAAELSAFREEMKAIAQSIPSGGMDAALADFRAGLEAMSGEIGQRVDGAAQRIEAAVGQLDVNRYDAASQRVESAAALMETSVQEALQALKNASSAMATPSPSDMFEEQDRDTV